MQKDKTKSLYAIYKFDFHKAIQRTIQAEADGIDGSKYLKNAQECFASLFDQNTIDKLAKINKKGEVTATLPNDVLKKLGDIFIWRVNNSQLKEWWKRNGKDSMGFDKYEKDTVESNPFCNVLIDNRPGVGIMAIEKSSAWGSNPDMLRDLLYRKDLSFVFPLWLFIIFQIIKLYGILKSLDFTSINVHLFQR